MLPGGSTLFVAPVVVGRVVARSTEKSQLLGQSSNPPVSYTHLTLPTTPYV